MEDACGHRWARSGSLPPAPRGAVRIGWMRVPAPRSRVPLGEGPRTRRRGRELAAAPRRCPGASAEPLRGARAAGQRSCAPEDAQAVPWAGLPDNTL